MEGNARADAAQHLQSTYSRNPRVHEHVGAAVSYCRFDGKVFWGRVGHRKVEEGGDGEADNGRNRDQGIGGGGGTRVARCQ